MKKDKIYALLKKPIGRNPNKYWNAFSFSSNANQNDVEAFMISIHILLGDYFLTMESDLERVRPHKGSSNAVSLYFHNSEKYGRIWVNDTPVGLNWVFRKYLGEKLKTRLFKVK